MDYIVTKIPKWDLAKFTNVNREVGSAMKSVGEVMAIGRTFEESLQKAIRQVDPRWKGFEAYVQPEDLDRALSKPTDMRLFAIAYAIFNKNYTIDQLHGLTKIDKVGNCAIRTARPLTRGAVRSGSCTRLRTSSTRFTLSRRRVPFNP